MASLNLYKGNYPLLLIPVVILTLVFLYVILVSPGITKGIDLAGGTLVIVRSDKAIDAEPLEALLKKEFNLTQLQVTSISSPTGGFGATVQFAANPDLQQAADELSLAREALKANDQAKAQAHALTVLNLTKRFTGAGDLQSKDAADAVEFAGFQLIAADQAFQEQLQDAIVKTFDLGRDVRFQKKEVGASLGKAFWDSAVMATLAAFAMVSIVIFVSFREIIPAVAITLATAFDILCALALMSLFKIPLDLSSIPSLLMLIGYSVDTEIVLNSRLTTRKDISPPERVMDAFYTGMTMTLTALAAVTAMLVFSYFGQIMIIFQIAAVLLFGLIGDIISTWFMNAPILLWYYGRKHAGGGRHR